MKSASPMVLKVAASVVALATMSACVGPPEPVGDRGAGAVTAPNREFDEADDHQAISQVPSRSPGSGRFRVRSEAGVEGGGVVESVVVGAFDEGDGSFEAALDLKRLVASAQGSVLAGSPPGLGDELVVRAAAGLVFVKVDARGWILLPGSLDDVLVEAGIVRPDALLDLLDQIGDGVVAVDGEFVDGYASTRYSGWLGPAALEAMGAATLAGGEGQATGLAPLAGIDGSKVPSEMLDRLVRFDVWVDTQGRARRLVVELDLDTAAEISRRVEGTDAGIVQLRLRHEVEWFDLDSDVTIEPPPRSEVSVIDVDALGDRDIPGGVRGSGSGLGGW